MRVLGKLVNDEINEVSDHPALLQVEISCQNTNTP